MSTASSSPTGRGFGGRGRRRAGACRRPRRAGPCRLVVDDVRIGAGVEQQRRELVVRVDDRDDERRGAVGIGEIEIRAAVDERLAGASAFSRAAYISGVQSPSGRTDWPARRCSRLEREQRRAAVEIGAVLERARGPRRRGSRAAAQISGALAVPVLARLESRAVREQRVATTRPSPCAPRSSARSRPRAARRSRRRRPSSSASMIAASPFDRGQLQRRHAVAIRGVRVGAGGEQRARRARASPIARPSAAPSCRRPRRR